MVYNIKDFKDFFTPEEYLDLYHNNNGLYMKYYYRFKKRGTIVPPYKKNGGDLYNNLTEEQMNILRHDKLRYNRVYKNFKKTGCVDTNLIYEKRTTFKNSMSKMDYDYLRENRREYKRQYTIYKNLNI